LLLVAAAGRAEERAIDFNRDIRPLLSDNCFKCHGPDAEQRQADLRLDTRVGLTADLGGYAPFVPGKPDESESLRRMTSDDAAERMPPPKSNKSLTPQQIALVREWVEQGAKWEPHWAFVAPRRAAVPAVKDESWPRGDIDRFLLARMEQEGLAPSAEADRHTLVRRVYLDLIGLPPTPEAADAFVADESSDAYEKLVDRLLASKHYGERWARRWLDLARYADTNGYEKDRPREIWAYRDWVIRALNDDMPFDRFTIEQIAGDMLPGDDRQRATLSQRIATGFHRNTMLNEEGGIDPLEFRFHAMTDRVATTGVAWLGLTTGCAQCHDHKFDPITQREYYRLLAFLNNADEPELELPDESLDRLAAQNRELAEAIVAELPGRWPVEEGRDPVAECERQFQQWLASQRQNTVEWTPLRPVSATSNLPFLTIEDDDSVFASGDTAKTDVYELEFRPQAGRITAVLLEALPDERLPERGPGSTYYEGTRGDFFLGEFVLAADGKPVTFNRASHSFAENRFGKNPVSAELALDGDPQTGWSVHGRQGERHTAVFVPSQPIEGAKALNLKMTFGRHFASSLGRFRISVTSDAAGAKATARDMPAAVESLLALPDDQLSNADRERLRRAFVLQSPELAEQVERIRELLRRPEYPTTLVMSERPPENPRPTFIHHRGEYLSPTERVEPGTPSALHPFPAELPRNRRGFARWLVSRENPLTARVVVNRRWAAFFGRGLAPTVQDFGMQGEPPSHPELLDWLAVELMEDGWSLKRLDKRIVMSAAYRQSSRVTPELLAVDAENVLLSRAPRFRLEAEILRDATLKSAGLLSTRMYGPPVHPPQPEGVTEAAYGKPKWSASVGEDRHRRSIYTFIKRTAPFAMYSTFDAPSGEACVARRDVSNTALQALTLLNDVMFVEASQAAGKLIADQSGDDEARMRNAFRRALTRPPSAEDLTDMQAFVAAQRERIARGELDARQIAGSETDAAERAVWTLLARALFSLDEAITRN
jgi:hypothetical protein